MKTATTHAQTIARWKTVTVLGHRWRYRHRCSCGVKDPERGDLREAEYDQREHTKEAAR